MSQPKSAPGRHRKYKQSPPGTLSSVNSRSSSSKTLVSTTLPPLFPAVELLPSPDAAHRAQHARFAAGLWPVACALAAVHNRSNCAHTSRLCQVYEIGTYDLLGHWKQALPEPALCQKKRREVAVKPSRMSCLPSATELSRSCRCGHIHCSLHKGVSHIVIPEFCFICRLQDRDAVLEKLRQTCNCQRDHITRQAEQIRELSRSLQDVTVSAQRQVPHPA